MATKLISACGEGDIHIQKHQEDETLCGKDIWYFRSTHKGVSCKECWKRYRAAKRYYSYVYKKEE